MKTKIRRILRNTDKQRRVSELKRLRDTTPLEALDAIIAFLGSSERTLRRNAARSLSLFREHMELRTETLAEQLRHNADDQIRLICAINLMNNLAPPVTLAYCCALEDPFEKVAQIACSEVGRRGGAQGTEALFRLLDHRSWRIRLEACKALIGQGTADDRVVTALELMAQDPEARLYDSECDEFEAAGKEITTIFGPALPRQRWGKLKTVIREARKLANLRRGRRRQSEAGK